MLSTGYETTIVTKTEMAEDKLSALKTKLTNIIEKHSGQVFHQEDWGKRKLAYSIQKERKGQYTFMVYKGDRNLVAELERNLRIQDEVIRFLTIKLDDECETPEFKKPSEYNAQGADTPSYQGGSSRSGGFRDRKLPSF